MKYTTAIRTGLALAACLAVPSSHALVIDDFEGGAQIFLQNGFTESAGVFVDPAGGTTVGNSRYGEILSSEGPPGSSLISINGMLAPGAYLQSEGGQARARVGLTWDGRMNPALSGGLGGIDFTEGGSQDGLRVEIVANAEIGLDSDAKFALTDTAGNSASLSLSPASGGTLIFPFADFNLLAGSTALDLSSIDVASLELKFEQNALVEILEVATWDDPSAAPIPVTSTGLLLGLGLTLLGYGRARVQGR